MMAKQKNKINFSFWICFIVSIFSLSHFFGGHKYISQGNDLGIKLFVPLSVFVFLASLVYMAFIIYAEEKENQNLKVKIDFFEFLYKLSKRGNKQND